MQLRLSGVTMTPVCEVIVKRENDKSPEKISHNIVIVRYNSFHNKT